MQAYIKDGYIWSFSNSFTRLFLERKNLMQKLILVFWSLPCPRGRNEGEGSEVHRSILTIEPCFPRLHLKMAQLLQAQVLSL